MALINLFKKQRNVNLVEDFSGFSIGDIELSSEVFNKMLSYAVCANSEISGFGKIKEVGDRVIVTEIRIFPQVCNGAHTTLEQDDLVRFMSEIIANGEKPEDWKLWWHSHYDFAAFFSGEDTSTIAQLTKASAIHPDGSKLYSICINNKGEMVARVDDNGVDSKMDVAIKPDHKSDAYKAIRKEVKKKVKQEVIKIGTFILRKDVNYGQENIEPTAEQDEPVTPFRLGVFGRTYEDKH